MTVYYSKEFNAFYQSAYRESYEKSADGWPADAVAIGDGEYQFLIDEKATGKIITPGADGYPVLSERPELTAEQQTQAAESTRASLLAVAREKAAALSYAVDADVMGDDIRPEDVEALKNWKRYVVQLTRLDLTAARNINWPEVPADVA